MTLLFSLNSFAGQWRAVLSRAGFLGVAALGVSYEITPDHAVDFLLGSYTMGGDRHLQSNFMYRYSHWHVAIGEDEWRPVQFGAFLVHASNNDKFFMKSPDIYPESNYYDATAIRYGAEVGSTYTWYPLRLGLSYHLRIFDNGLIAIFNNSNRDLQYYISSGVSLQYVF